MAAANHRAILDAAPRGVRVVATYFVVDAINTYHEIQLPPYSTIAAIFMSTTVANGNYVGPAVAGSAAATAVHGDATTPATFPVLVAAGSEMQLYAAPDDAEPGTTPRLSDSIFVASADATTRFHLVYVRK